MNSTSEISPDSVHPSAAQAVSQLRAQFPDTPFLTLGQTVLWDEPTKAAFCRILEAVAPDARMMAAVHDTDYFAKLPDPHLETSGAPFEVLEHNDGDTRGLWSAAGEISGFLGAETVAARAILTSFGVAFDRVARGYPGGERALLNAETSAWGWRAIVHTGTHSLIAADVKLAQVLAALKEQLNWAFDASYQIAPQGRDTFDVGALIHSWIDEFVSQNPNATLSNLYQWLTPKLWCMVRGGGGCNLQISSSMELFRFNSQTCKRPRFSFLELFLNPQSRDIARECYNSAVLGSGIYTLDAFGSGATPFDVVIPGRGRGTLRVDNGSIWVQTETPITVCSGCDCQSVEQLAELLETQFGPDVAIVGKAVALISMLSAEFIFVFHEKASSYTARTQQMNTQMRERGLNLSLHPMLRLKYATWDALGEVEADLSLPSHLARAFGAHNIAASEFAKRWEKVCESEAQVLAELKELHAPRDLMSWLAREDDVWNGRRAEYEAAREQVRATRAQTRELEAEIESLKLQTRAYKAELLLVEKRKGEDFRARVQPLRTQIADICEAQFARLNPLDESGAPRKIGKEERAQNAELSVQENARVQELQTQIAQLQQERARFDDEFDAALRAARQSRAAVTVKTQRRVELERSSQMQAARARVAQLEYEAELSRLKRTRDAYMSCESLKQTNLRPTAWWFPLVSPDAKWFHQLARTTQARIETL